MFTALLLSCLLSVCLPGDTATPAPAAPGPAPQADVDLVSAVYDLERVWTVPEFDVRLLRTVPFRFGYTDDEGAGELWDENFPVDELTSFLWETVAPGEFEYEGRVLEADGPRRLRVTAPAAVQADVRATLDWLAATLQRTARLDIDAWRTVGNGALPDLADASALAAAEAAGTLLRLASRHETLLLGRTERRSALTRTAYLRDWEIEIAQQAVAAQPEFETLETGLQLLLRLEPEPGGHATLRFAVQLSELRSMERRTLPLLASINLESGSHHETVGGVLDQPSVAFATLAGSRVLAPGEEFVTAAWAQTLEAPVGYVVRYRLAALDPEPAPLALPASGQAGRSGIVVQAIELSPALWPALGAEAPTTGQYCEAPYEGVLDQKWLRFPSSERKDPLGLLDQAVAPIGVPEEASLWTIGSTAIVGAEAAVTESLCATIAGQLPRRRSLTLDLELTGSRPGSPDQAVARASWPLCTGDTGVLVAGCAHLLLAGFDVDVANGSSAPDPTVSGCLDGLAVRARARADGAVALDLLSQRGLRREQVDLRVPGLLPVDRLDLGVVTLSPELQADGAWHSATDLAGGFDGSQLALRWRLTAP